MAGKKHSSIWEAAKIVIVAIVAAFIVRYFLFAPIIVEGHSMMPTLHNHDRVIINKFSYDIGEPERFDIIVFHATKKKDFIKRVIGLPGEHIAYRNDVLYVDGEKVKEPYLRPYKQKVSGNLTYDFTLQEKIGRYTVPEGELFVMGDNRRNSYDSRNIGTIDIDDVVGEAAVLFWPLQDFTIIE